MLSSPIPWELASYGQHLLTRLQCLLSLIFTPWSVILFICVCTGYSDWLLRKTRWWKLWNVIYKISFFKKDIDFCLACTLSFSHLLSLLALLKHSTWWRNSYRKAFHAINMSIFPFMEHVLCVKSNKPTSNSGSWGCSLFVCLFYF